ncbi:DMT family transporter [Thermococcus stetteri]|uniref:DMT family transporter n=1 Tax=Thermococcus stetteri TaxID=49900 RepID=UPI001AE4FA42|nr:DMT family transporter [Thermococcus stetteri]MBP1911639.1 drug/metabolite transporter (DMT)-like permease [Thermococcus stetteri]
MKKAELALLGVTVFWGFTFPAMKVSLDYFPPILFLTYRFALASLLLLLIFGRKVLKRETFKEGFILGLTLFFGHGFQIVGLKYTTVSNSAFITSLYVVFTPFIAYFMLGEKVTRRDLNSLALAVIGLYLISGAGTSINYGDFLTLLCAVSFAFQIVLVHKFGEKDYLSLNFWQLFWNFVFSAVFALAFEEPVSPKEILPWAGVVYTAVFATVIAFTVQLKYQRYTTAQRAALIYSSEPVFGSLAAYLTLGETLSLRGYLGAALIMSGILNEVRKK